MSTRLNPPVERVTVQAERVDDFNDRRYLVTLTLIVPADTVGEAIAAVVDAVKDVT